MRIISALLFFLVLSPMLLLAAKPISVKTASQQAAVPASSSQTDIQKLREDIQRMRNLVQQMEQNLAFVDTTQSPLKHQFQIEIDMWKTVIDQMERTLNSSKAR